MDNLPYSVNYKEQPEKCTMQFSGQLIINYIENITELVKKSITTTKDLEIVIENPESVDVTFIQLLLSIKSTFKNSEKKVSIKTNLKDELETLINNSGFNYVLN